jgi:hypothetical protein
MTVECSDAQRPRVDSHRAACAHHFSGVDFLIGLDRLWNGRALLLGTAPKSVQGRMGEADVTDFKCKVCDDTHCVCEDHHDRGRAREISRSERNDSPDVGLPWQENISAGTC